VPAELVRRLSLPVLALVVAIALAVGPPGAAGLAAAQEDPSTTGAPAPNIIPEPNEGHEPTEAGDRGGALQLLVLGLVVVGIGGAVLHLTRVSRRARAGQEP
jgi:hypothetical protein